MLKRTSDRITVFLEIAILASSITGIGYRTLFSGGIIATLDALGYFTMQSNIAGFFVVVVSMVRRLRRKTPVSDMTAGAVCVYLVITMIVYQTMLGPGLEAEGLNAVILQVNHLATPVLYTFWFLFKIARVRPKYSHAFIFLIYPAIYSILGTIEGLIRGSFRYFFLDVKSLRVPVYIFFICTIFLAFLLAALLIIRHLRYSYDHRIRRDSVVEEIPSRQDGR